MSAESVATAVYLRDLLTRPGPYRARWLRHARRTPQGGINQAAVAQVLAAYMWDTGEVDDRDRDLPRRLKDLVSRALGGKALPPRTLQMFIAAFGVTADDAQQLLAASIGEPTGRWVVVCGGARPPEAPARTYETISLHEFHVVGPDRIPTEHRTVQGILATAPLASYRYMFDTSAVAIDIVRGGYSSPVYETESQGLFAVDINLTTPLEAGETASFEYRTVFGYPEPPEPAFRRVARKRVENAEINVRFHPECLPRAIWWRVWDAVDFEVVISSERVQLDADHTVHRFVRTLEGRGVGFAWEWPA